MYNRLPLQKLRGQLKQFRVKANFCVKVTLLKTNSVTKFFLKTFSKFLRAKKVAARTLVATDEFSKN